MFQRLQVRILALYTGWTFFTFNCCKNCNVCLKRRKYIKKRPGLAQLSKKKYLLTFACMLLQNSKQLEVDRMGVTIVSCKNVSLADVIADVNDVESTQNEPKKEVSQYISEVGFSVENVSVVSFVADVKIKIGTLFGAS